MSKQFTKEEIIEHKNKAIQKLDAFLTELIDSEDLNNQKKANLISYWLENFIKHISEENSFNPARLISYKRGNIVKVDFGFNIGSEQGGLHYAVVLDNNNKHNSPVITVIPLSSGNENNTYPTDVYLGQELYNRLHVKVANLLSETQNKISETEQLLKILSLSEDETSEEYGNVINKLQIQLDDNHAHMKLLAKYKRELQHMKIGSRALIGQITTISKQRIYIPKNTNDVLYGISFSSEAMNKIDTQIRKLYTFKG